MLDADGNQGQGIAALVAAVRRRAPLDAAGILSRNPDSVVAEVLNRLDPNLALRIILRLPEHRRQSVTPVITTSAGVQWRHNSQYPAGSVGRLMQAPVGVLPGTLTVADSVPRIRDMSRDALITYVYVTDDQDILRGVVVMRDILLADAQSRLEDIMIAEPFRLNPQTTVADASQEVLARHYPVYPVCDDDGRLLGLVQGYVLFEEQSLNLSAQAGRMVGVDNEEHFATPWNECLRMRHPWLQLNLLTAFLAAFVVGMFEDTIQRVVVLAVFLPVLAGQAGNTGCQALAVTLRSMTLGEFDERDGRRVLNKESLLGMLNGVLVGLVAALGMFLYASLNHTAQPLMLATVVFMAMVASCVASGLSGVLVPLALKRIGADPVTASSIFLTTATDIASMGVFLGLASVILA